MNYNGSFNPKYLTGTQLYFAKNTATVSSWNDQSSNGYNLSQAVALQQPTIGTNSVDFVPNQFMSRTVANVFSGHTVGSIFIGFYMGTSGSVQFLLASGDTGSSTRFFQINVRGASNRISIATSNNTGIQQVEGSTTLVTGTYYCVEFRQSGSAISIYINGVAETLTVLAGSNSGNIWWSFPTLRDNLTIGARIINATSFTEAKINKIYYHNGAMSASDIWKTTEFMKNPLNYV